MLGYKTYATVIMDGSNKHVNNEISGLIDMGTRRLIGRSRYRKLDKNHPTMKVIKRFTNAEKYRQTRLLIEKHYPGLCTFDAVIK